MGHIVNRGTRDNPRWIAQYKDADGVRRSRLLRGAKTRPEARRALQTIEWRVFTGKVGVPGIAEAMPSGDAKMAREVADIAERAIRVLCSMRIRSEKER